MKKTILPLFVLITLPVIAKTVTPDTQLRWNSLIVEEAASKSGFARYRETYYAILNDLLERDTFSCREAASICKQKCLSMKFYSEDTEEQLGPDSPEVEYFCKETCTNFVYALINRYRLKNDKSLVNNPCFPDRRDKRCVFLKFGYSTQVSDNITLSDIIEFDKNYNKRLCSIDQSFTDMCAYYKLDEINNCTYIPCKNNNGEIVSMYQIETREEDAYGEMTQNLCLIMGGGAAISYTGWPTRCTYVSENDCNILKQNFGHKVEIKYVQDDNVCQIGKYSDKIYGGSINGKDFYYILNPTTGEYERENLF